MARPIRRDPNRAQVTTYWCELAWVGGPQAEPGVLLEVDEGRIAKVVTGLRQAPAGAESIPGLTLPGLVSAHSHAFQRALRGRAESGADSFWTWRENMYRLADRLDPDRYLDLARATFGEMLLAGITLVGEFHYLHHGPQGAPYDPPNRMAEALAAAAREAGIRLTLIDACYLEGGFGRPAQGAQLRFCDEDVDAWAARVEDLRQTPWLRVAAAVHSVRAVPPEAVSAVARWSAERRRPLHAHVSEQPEENQACLERFGRTPVELLEESGALSPLFTAVHATHLTEEDFQVLGRHEVCSCLCPSTERNLGDGIARAARLRQAGVRLALGTDSEAVIDLIEEARAVEMDERLASGRRGLHDAAALIGAATSGGAQSLGWPEAGAIAAGSLADLTVVGLDGVRLAGWRPDQVLEMAVFSAVAADVSQVMVDGEWVVREGRHLRLDVPRELERSIRALDF